MATILVVRTIDVNYATLDGAAVTATLAEGSAQPMTQVETGAFELPLDDGVQKITVNVTHKELFPIEQKLLLDAPEGGTPTLKFDGDQKSRVRNVDNHSRDGGDHSVEVIVVPGILRNANPRATEVAAAETKKHRNVFLTPRTLDILRFNDQLLSPQGSGSTFEHETKSIEPKGQFILLECIRPPKLVCIHVPQSMFDIYKRRGNNDMRKVSIPYHVFFHPNTAHFEPKNYPFSHDYLDLVARYCTYAQVFNAGKAMINQHEIAEQEVVFVFPVGGRIDSFGDAQTQAGLLRLLQEVNYQLQRWLEVPYPLQDVGKVAISGFSAGITAVANVLGGKRVGLFHDELLREVYSFDGIFMTKNADGAFVQDVGATQSFINNVKSWLRNGEDDRAIRFYTQNRIFLDGLKDAIVNPTTTKGPKGSTEVFGDNGTLLHAPPGMWLGVEKDIRKAAVNPGDLSRSVHQFIPAGFMSHAIQMSKLKRS